MKKIGNIAVAVGSYTDKNNSKKALWEQVGSLLENEKGQRFLSIKRTFNPAGVPLAENGSNVREVMLGVFPEKKS